MGDDRSRFDRRCGAVLHVRSSTPWLNLSSEWSRRMPPARAGRTSRASSGWVVVRTLPPGGQGRSRNGSLAQGDMTFMGLLDRILNRRASADRRAAASAPALVAPPPATNVVLLGGSHDLEVVGESQYQDALWRVAGGRTAERVRVEVQAVLLAEPDNPYDPNAITVLIDGAKVGYLCRDDAQAYRPGLLALEDALSGLDRPLRSGCRWRHAAGRPRDARRVALS